MLGHHPEIALPLVLFPHRIGRAPGGRCDRLRNASFVDAQIRCGKGRSEAPLQQVGQDRRILWCALEEARQERRHAAMGGCGLNLAKGLGKLSDQEMPLVLGGRAAHVLPPVVMTGVAAALPQSRLRVQAPRPGPWCP